MKKQLHVLIHGKVQGVNFRWATQQKAVQLGLTGWIKNTSDRKVEAVFEGEEETLRQMFEFIKKGPPAARVTTVEEEWSVATGVYLDFSIAY